MAACPFVNRYRRFGGTCSHHIKGVYQ